LQGRDIQVHGRITLIWILKKYNTRIWAGFIIFRTASSGDECGKTIL
jgi:hypothetical protein